jgi:hypothetical protein
MMFAAPERSEAAEYYFTYINQVPAGDIRSILRAQLPEVRALLGGISEDRSRHAYAAGKWTIRDVLGHLNDTERLFVFRAFWFARGFTEPLPSFDQNVAVAHAAAADRSWASLIDEFVAVRGASLAFFDHLPDEAWAAHGVASGNPFTVRALAYMTAGHATHHLRIVREKYLSLAPPPASRA